MPHGKARTCLTAAATVWLWLDPTHDCAQSSEYVRVAIGRDYADVPPTRGVFKGIVKEMMDMKVTIAKM